MNGVYYNRPSKQLWTAQSFIVGGDWCIEVENGDVSEKFYGFQLPLWSIFWDDKKKYSKLLEMATKWTQRQDAKIVKAQQMWDAMEAARGVKQ